MTVVYRHDRDYELSHIIPSFTELRNGITIPFLNKPLFPTLVRHD